MRFKHDCEKCVGLGEWFEYDLYFHPAGEEGMKTVIARSGDGGEDYVSGFEMVRYFPALGEAKRLAIEKGMMEADLPHRMVK